MCVDLSLGFLFYSTDLCFCLCASTILYGDWSSDVCSSDLVSVGTWIYLWAFYFVPLIYVSVFVPVPYCLDDCGCVVEPEVRQVDSSSSILHSQNCFGYLRFFLYFHTNCEIICSSSLKNTIGILIGITLIGIDSLIGIASIDCFG